jgi:shikimate dehydrogenase
MSIRRLAVIGSPVAHSLSPDLHAAAYAVLGLDWEYSRHEVREGELAGFLDGLDRSWRGLSVTMPLKEELARLADESDHTVDLTGAANTVLLTNEGRRIARNTDVAGVEKALDAAGMSTVRHAVVAGAGATARSVVVALSAMGLRSVTIAVREAARAGALVALAERLDLDVDLVSLTDLSHVVDGAEVVAWTLPNGVEIGAALPADARQSAIALDVTYDPWPGPLAAQWHEAGGRVVSGRDLLLHQAVRQVRFFVSGQTEVPIESEAAVAVAMAAALT